jgi:hypothetical protein
LYEIYLSYVQRTLYGRFYYYYLLLFFFFYIHALKLACIIYIYNKCICIRFTVTGDARKNIVKLFPLWTPRVLCEFITIYKHLLRYRNTARCTIRYTSFCISCPVINNDCIMAARKLSVFVVYVITGERPPRSAINYIILAMKTIRLWARVFEQLWTTVRSTSWSTVCYTIRSNRISSNDLKLILVYDIS